MILCSLNFSYQALTGKRIHLRNKTEESTVLKNSYGGLKRRGIPRVVWYQWAIEVDGDDRITLAAERSMSDYRGRGHRLCSLRTPRAYILYGGSVTLAAAPRCKINDT